MNAIHARSQLRYWPTREVVELSIIQPRAERQTRAPGVDQGAVVAEASESRTHPSRVKREATGFEDREGHRAPLASARKHTSRADSLPASPRGRLRQVELRPV